MRQKCVCVCMFTLSFPRCPSFGDDLCATQGESSRVKVKVRKKEKVRKMPS